MVATHRTSLIVDPPDGRLPPLTSRGKERDAALDAKSKAAAGPEDLTTWDRCLLGFNAGPPIIGGGYNANVQVFQTADYVVLLTEMVHDARIIPLDRRPPLPSHVRQWKGDSRGRWDGDTLVIESRNFQAGGTGTLSLRNGGLGFSADENLRLTERIRRLNADTLSYEYTVDDPTVWTRPWTVSMTMQKSERADVRVRVPRGQLRHELASCPARGRQKKPRRPQGPRRNQDRSATRHQTPTQTLLAEAGHPAPWPRVDIRSRRRNACALKGRKHSGQPMSIVAGCRPAPVPDRAVNRGDGQSALKPFSEPLPPVNWQAASTSGTPLTRQWPKAVPPPARVLSMRTQLSRNGWSLAKNPGPK